MRAHSVCPCASKYNKTQYTENSPIKETCIGIDFQFSHFSLLSKHFSSLFRMHFDLMFGFLSLRYFPCQYLFLHHDRKIEYFFISSSKHNNEFIRFSSFHATPMIACDEQIYVKCMNILIRWQYIFLILFINRFYVSIQTQCHQLISFDSNWNHKNFSHLQFQKRSIEMCVCFIIKDTFSLADAVCVCACVYACV